LKQVKSELGAAGACSISTPSSDERALFRYHMHTLPSEVAGSIGTSTLFAAWNAAIYVSQVEDDRLPRSSPPTSISTRPPKCCASTAAFGSTTNLRDFAAP